MNDKSIFFGNFEGSYVDDNKINPDIMKEYRNNVWVKYFGCVIYEECSKYDDSSPSIEPSSKHTLDFWTYNFIIFCTYMTLYFVTKKKQK